MRSTAFQSEAWEGNQYVWDKVDEFQNFSTLATMQFLLGSLSQSKSQLCSSAVVAIVLI